MMFNTVHFLVSLTILLNSPLILLLSSGSVSGRDKCIHDVSGWKLGIGDMYVGIVLEKDLFTSIIFYLL